MNDHICWPARRARDGSTWYCEICGQNWRYKDGKWRMVAKS